MIADIVQSNFPDGISLPAYLRLLCEYLDANGYPVSGCFEICKRGRRDAEEWFPGDTTTQRLVAVFGKGSTGSSYALWLVPDHNSETAPVVVFGSEGDFLVLASNALEFCRLLGCGYNEVESDDLSKPPSQWEETAPLRAWLSDRLPLEFPATGEAISRVARDRHPGFATWMQAWQSANLHP